MSVADGEIPTGKASSKSFSTGLKKTFGWFLRLAITVGILSYLFTKISFSEVIDSIASARVGYVLAAFLFYTLMVCISACRMKLLLQRQGVSISLLDIIGINFSTNFYGLFLPGGHLTGTLIRWHRFSKSDGKPAEAMASIIFDRIVDITILCLLGVVFWALDRPYDRSYIGLSLGAILGGLSLFYALMFTRVAVTSQMSLNYLIGLPLIPKVVSSKVGKLITSLSQYKDLSNSDLAILVSISFVYQFIGIVAAYFFVLGLDLKISLITIAWVRSARLVIAMLPISISGVGVREWTSVFLLTPYGVSAADAIALSLLSYGSRLWLGAIGGLLEAANFFRPARRKSNEKSSGIKKEKLTL